MRLTQFIKPLTRFLQTAPAPPPAVVHQADKDANSGAQDSPSPRIHPTVSDGDALRRLAALDTIADAQRIATLVTDAPSSQVRQLAAQRIEDPAELRRLLKLLRGRDKNVYRIIKQKCDALHAEETRIAQIHGEIETLCASLERHSHRIYDPLYPASLRQFEAQWRTLAPAAGDQAQQRIRESLDRCKEVIEAHERQVAEQAEAAQRRAARETAASQAAEEARHRQELAAQAAADAQAAAARLREAEDEARANKLAADRLALRQMNGLIGKANSALREGNTGRAAGLRRAIEEKLPSLPMVPAYLTAQVQKLDAALNDLKGWKDYAAAPKRVELIEAMEALIGSTEEPDALAARIRQLQEDWKTLSLGLVTDSEADWQRFHLASQTAYQPCREYFEAQARLRQENVERRREVLERLRAFEAAQSGEHPDWRAVATALREAPREWRGYSPVERAAVRALQDAFDAVIGRLQTRLDAWYEQNAADKRALIQRAQQLLANEDSRDNLDAVKRLQQQWKALGSARRDQEQPLWLAFREQCDAVYQKRQQAHAEFTAALEANKSQAERLCQQAEHAAELSGPALLEGVGQIPEWRAAFEALGNMPRADERGLHERFERAIKRCQESVSEARTREREQSFLNLFEAARLIGAYGAAVAAAGAADSGAADEDGASAGTRDALKQAAEAFIAGVERWPKGGAEALKQAWVKSHSAAGIDLTAQALALRMLCIRAEILIDAPTPAEDQALRREFQVQRLLQRRGQPSDAPTDEIDTLALEWVRVGPADAAAQPALFQRFLGCRQASPAGK